MKILVPSNKPWLFHTDFPYPALWSFEKGLKNPKDSKADIVCNAGKGLYANRLTLLRAVAPTEKVMFVDDDDRIEIFRKLKPLDGLERSPLVGNDVYITGICLQPEMFQGMPSADGIFFGEDFLFRAWLISQGLTVKRKPANGFYKYSLDGESSRATSSVLERLTEGYEGVSRLLTLATGNFRVAVQELYETYAKLVKG